MATDLHTMTNTEWLDAVQSVLLDEGEDAALDVVYKSIGDAHDAPDRIWTTSRGSRAKTGGGSAPRSRSQTTRSASRR